MSTNRILVAMTALALTGMAHAADCPDAVKASVTKAHPGATMTSCKSEKEKGAKQYVVVLTTADKQTVEVDVLPDGKILQTEEPIAVDKIPATVMSAFRSKAGNAEPASAVKQTLADGKVEYEIAFKSGAKKKEITIGEAGVVLEEE